MSLLSSSYSRDRNFVGTYNRSLVVATHPLHDRQIGVYFTGGVRALDVHSIVQEFRLCSTLKFWRTYLVLKGLPTASNSIEPELTALYDYQLRSAYTRWACVAC